MWPLIGAGIGAAANLVNGILNRDAQQEANEVNAANQLHMNTVNATREDRIRADDLAVATAWRNDDRDRFLADRNFSTALQKEFAQSGIQWRAEDARKAGISPLFALGGGGATYSPSSTVGGGSPPRSTFTPGIAPRDAPAPLNLGSMGQDISRAIMATASNSGRSAIFNEAVNEATLQNLTLKNELLSSQIGRLKSGQTGPGIPSSSGFSEWSGRHEWDDPEKIPRLNLGHGPIKNDPNVSNAEDFEKRYGEMSDWIFGPYIAYKDYQLNTGGIGAHIGSMIRGAADRFSAAAANTRYRNAVSEKWRGHY